MENGHFQEYSQEYFTEFVGLSKKKSLFTVITTAYFPTLQYWGFGGKRAKMSPREKVNGLKKATFLFQGVLWTGLSSWDPPSH